MIVNDTFTALLAGMALGAAWCYAFLAWWTAQTEQEPEDLDVEGLRRVASHYGYDATSIVLDEPLPWSHPDADPIGDILRYDDRGLTFTSSAIDPEILRRAQRDTGCDHPLFVMGPGGSICWARAPWYRRWPARVLDILAWPWEQLR